MKKTSRRKVKGARRNPENIYFEIYEPNTLRKQILTSAIEVIDTLRDYEVSKDVKTEKEKQIRQLKSTLFHMKSSFRSLKNSLPAIPKDALPKPEKKHSLTKEINVEIKRIKELTPQDRFPQESSTVKRLENELSQIRNKLNNL